MFPPPLAAARRHVPPPLLVPLLLLLTGNPLQQALFELAILRLFSTTTETDVKVVYMAPTKSLCSERARDWKTKFAPLGWNVIELTGDSTLATSKEIGSASVIVTTPEKWDVISRRW